MLKAMKILLFFLESTAGSLVSQSVYAGIAEPCLWRVLINIKDIW